MWELARIRSKTNRKNKSRGSESFDGSELGNTMVRFNEFA